MLVPPGTTQPDLGLELGLSAWMHTNGLEVEEAVEQLWAIREAILDGGPPDRAIEPVPFTGTCGRLDLLNLTVYLGTLVPRAAAARGCGSDQIVERALEHPALRVADTPGREGASKLVGVRRLARIRSTVWG